MDAPALVVPSVELPPTTPHDHGATKAALTPPTSEDNDKRDERMSSELSELDSDDGEDIEPDHYFEGGKIPVFKPTMDQFRNFKRFIDKIDKHGMKSGIVKVIPPNEWRNHLPDLSEQIKSIKVKNPIMQEFAGQHGIYTQANIEKQRSYNLPEWRAVTDEPHHQPPAKRGERRKTAAEPPSRTRTTRAQAAPVKDDDTPKRGPGRPRRRQTRAAKKEDDDDDDDAESMDVPPTPTSPGKEEKRSTRRRIKKEDQDDAPQIKARGGGRQPKTDQKKSVSSRRLNNRGAVADYIDEEAFDEFDYHLEGLDEYTVERCKELEDNYWKTINYGQPMYGADMPGSLFDDQTTSWNVAKLPNLLDVLGTKVPGVNTAYLYLGMWKATFAWHLEDVDLYSINYIHFGAPKQWYSISQEDARRFEAAMKSIWPNDAKHCSQFLRHKTYLISPQRLEKDFNIKVNRLVHYEGEFVITYPYGYHSGYNIGYNCAESVNFANESWLSYGRIAKKCNCESDSVWVDVNEIERKLRGEPTPEYYEETDDEDEEDSVDHLPSPSPSVVGKPKRKPGRKPGNKRKRGNDESQDVPRPKKLKRIRIRLKIPGRGMPCILCPNDVEYDELLLTDNGMKAHRICADYTPETWISANPNEKICNVANIGKDRLELKCNYCRSKRGAVFQCSQKKCTRAFHATCAVAAGVQVDLGPMPTFDEEGTEYFYDGYDFRCRFHRPKKRNNKTVDVESLEKDKFIMSYGKTLKPKDVIQFQYVGGEMYQIYGAQVVENRPGEQSALVDVLPDGDRVEVEWKYILKLHPEESQRPKPSANAKPLPDHLKESDASLDITNRTDGVPEIGDPFHDPNSEEKWAEWHTAPDVTRQVVKIDFSKENQLWYYLGKPSTEAKPQYTENLALRRNNPKSNFMDTVRPPPPPVPTFERRSYPASYPLKPAPIHTQMPPRTPMQQQQQQQLRPAERPYAYKPRDGIMNTWKSPSYNPGVDTRNNPNSPVAHQPNVSYDHRAPGPQNGQQPYPIHHTQRPQQQHQYQYQPYVPPQAHSTLTWKQQPQTPGQMLGGTDQYAHPYQPNQALPPYPYQPPANAQSSRQPPPFPYSSGAGPNVMPAYSPAGAHNRATEAPAPSPSPSSHSRTSVSKMLSNQSGTPNPPIPGGGFTPEWKPKPATSIGAAHPAIAPRPSSMGGPVSVPPQGYTQAHPPSASSTAKPTAQFQSSHEFQREMGRVSQSASEAPKWNQLLQQLNPSSGPSPTPTIAVPSPYAPQPQYPPPSLRSSASWDTPGHPPVTENHAPPLPPPATESQRPIPSPLSDIAKSPERLECSPPRDDGKSTAAATTQDEPESTSLQPSQSPNAHGTGAETWRYT